MTYLKLLFILSIAMIATGKVTAQSELSKPIYVELKVNGKYHQIEKASVTINRGYFAIYGNFGEKETAGDGADLSLTLRDVQQKGSYVLYGAGLKFAGKDYFSQEKGGITITKWEDGKISGNFSAFPKSNGEQCEIEGTFYTEIEKIRLKVTTAWDCSQLAFAGATMIPFPYATFQIENYIFSTDMYGTAFIEIPVGRYKVTVFDPDPEKYTEPVETGELVAIPDKQPGALNYAVWKGENVPRAKEEPYEGLWSAGTINFTMADEMKELRLVAMDCPEYFNQLEGRKGIKYIVTNLFGNPRVLHLGTWKTITRGMEIVSGDNIVTDEESAVGLQLEKGSIGETISIVEVRKSSAFQFFIYETSKHELARRIIVGGTYWEQIITGSSIHTYTEKNLPFETVKTTIVDENCWGEEDGTKYTWTYDTLTHKTTVSVEEGVMHLTPRNKKFKPVSIKAGEKIELTPDYVGPISPSAPDKSNSNNSFTEQPYEKPRIITNEPPIYVYIIPVVLLGVVVAIVTVVYNRKRKKKGNRSA